MFCFRCFKGSIYLNSEAQIRFCFGCSAFFTNDNESFIKTKIAFLLMLLDGLHFLKIFHFI